MTATTGFNSKNRSQIKYMYGSKVKPAVAMQKSPGLPKKCVQGSDIDTDEGDLEEDSEVEMSKSGSESSSSDKENNKVPQKFSQAELNDLGRELGLSKEAYELLASRLKEKHLLEKGVKITVYRNREQEMTSFFERDKELNLVYCENILKLINSFNAGEYKTTDWRLFIDSSCRSLKAVLLHNTNVLAPIPVAHSTILKESYENVKIVFDKIKYSDRNWLICGDLKIIGIILGMQSGNIKYPGFLCLFDSRDRSNHYEKKKWPSRDSLEPGSPNVLQTPLVDVSKILIPPLHLKLGLMTQFVKALDKSGACYAYIAQKMPTLSDAKLEAGIFDGPKIRQLFNDINFTDHMTKTERDAWTSFKNVCQNFLGNKKSPMY